MHIKLTSKLIYVSITNNQYSMFLEPIIVLVQKSYPIQTVTGVTVIQDGCSFRFLESLKYQHRGMA